MCASMNLILVFARICTLNFKNVFICYLGLIFLEKSNEVLNLRKSLEKIAYPVFSRRRILAMFNLKNAYCNNRINISISSQSSGSSISSQSRITENSKKAVQTGKELTLVKTRKKTWCVYSLLNSQNLLVQS